MNSNSKIKSIFINSIYSQLTKRIILITALYSVLRILFYAFNYDYFNNVSFTGFLNIMRGGLVFDLSAIAYTNSLIIVLSLLPVKFKYHKLYQGSLRFLFIVINTLCLIINFSDIVYYRFTLRRTTATIFNEFKHDDNLFNIFYSSLFDFWPVTLTALFFIVVFIVFEFKIRRPQNQTKSNWVFFPAQLVMFFIVTALTIGAMRGGFAESTRPITLSNAAKYINQPDERALVLNTPFALIRTIDKKQLKKVEYLPQEELEKHYSVVHKAIHSDSTSNKPNVVIIILESFGRGHIGCLNKDIEGFKSYTPFIDSLSNHAWVYKNAFANGRKSIDALPSILASIPSVKEPFVLSAYSGNNINSIPSLLNKEGYYTAFFHGAPNGSMGLDAFANQAGFKDYYGKDEYNNDADFDGIWGIWDEPFFQFFANKMGEFKQPFMTSIFSVSSHHPFKVPEKYVDVFPEGELPLQKCLAYTDNALREFFDNCKKQPWFSNTLFVITADHASKTNIPKYLTTGGSFAIPMLFYKPNDERLKAFNDSVNAQQIDIMPTILNYVGVKNDYIAFGTDLFKNPSNQFAFNYRNDMYQAIKNNYLLQFDGKKTTALYHITEDPLQENNLINNEPEKAKELETKLKCIFQEYSNRLIENRLVMQPE